MEISIEVAKNHDDYKEIADFARIVWTQHYTSLIGIDQVNYMIDKLQSLDVIQAQCSSGEYKYYKAMFNDEIIGYCAIIHDEDDSIFLSKIYIDQKHRGKGVGKKMISNFIEEYRPQGITSVCLMVNKGNSDSIKAYEKIGFKRDGEIVADIGGGFVMDDYKMTLIL